MHIKICGEIRCEIQFGSERNELVLSVLCGGLRFNVEIPHSSTLEWKRMKHTFCGVRFFSIL